VGAHMGRIQKVTERG